RWQRKETGAAGQILPTHPRLSGAVLAGLADPQAEGNPPGPGRTAAGGSGGGVECPAGESPASLALAVVPNPLADAEAEMDLAAAQDDAEGDPLLCGAGCYYCRALCREYRCRRRYSRAGSRTTECHSCCRSGPEPSQGGHGPGAIARQSNG